MIAVSPALGLFGSWIRAVMIRNELEALPGRPADAGPFSKRFFYGRINWYFAWGVAGLGAGLLVALLFVGTVETGASSIARVFAIALARGYGAPSLRKGQLGAVRELVDGHLTELGKRI